MANVLLFASIKEKLQQDSLSIPATIETVEQLEQWLIDTYPQIEDELSNVIWAKNEEFVEKSTQIEKDDVIAIITPVSGG